jgi:Sigma-70 region 2
MLCESSCAAGKRVYDVDPDSEFVRRASLRADRMSDVSLLAGLGGNSPDVVVAFVRRFQVQVFRVAYAVVGDRGLAEDVAQQTLERAWRRASTFDPDRGTVRSWLLSIARNVAIDTVRVQTTVSIDPGELVRLRGSESMTQNSKQSEPRPAPGCGLPYAGFPPRRLAPW